MPTSAAVAEYRSSASRRRRILTRAAQEVGPLPAVADPARRARAEASFQAFCEVYFPHLFPLAWSDDHLLVIAGIEAAVLHGGQQAIAMPRGSGKTTLCQIAALWAILIGAQPFVMFIAASADKASEALQNLKTHLTTNELLAADFPEACVPIRLLENEARRCIGQRYYGKQTHIGWTSDQIVLPTIPGSRCSGALVRTSGITGSIRGANHIRPDGTSIRPTLVIIDDPQTDDSAKSVSQVAERLHIIESSVLNLAGPDRSIAAIMPCTVIHPDDVADQVLDRTRHPEWNGVRTKMLYALPENLELWERYAVLRADSFRAGCRGEEATDFYKVNRDAMDAGARPGWPARFNSKELSAVQHAMNIRIDRPRAFAAEYQNEPLRPEADRELMTPEQIRRKINNRPAGVVPEICEHVTAFVDVQQDALYWMICAWRGDFTGFIIDYGTTPDQRSRHFTYRHLRFKLGDGRGDGVEPAIYAGLAELIDQQIGPRIFKRADGGESRLSLAMIDANWKTDTVNLFIRQSKFANVLLPSHGKYFGAKSTPITGWKRKPGWSYGDHFIVARSERGQRHVIIDTNYWKSFAHERLALALGADGSLSLFGDRPELHDNLAAHLTAEIPKTVKHGDRAIAEWELKPGAPDNHWLDCLIGNCVAASRLGCAPLAGLRPVRRTPPKRLSYSELQKHRAAGAGGAKRIPS